jgi:hypothetical protein
MAETIVLMSFAQTAIESAKPIGIAAEDTEQLLKLTTEFDSIAAGSPGPERRKALVTKTREIHALCQRMRVTAVAKIGGAGALASRPDCSTLLETLQKVRDMAAHEATKVHG